MGSAAAFRPQPVSGDHKSRLGLAAERVRQLEEQAGEVLDEMFGAVQQGDPSASIWWTRAITPDFPIVSELQPR